MNIEDRVFSDLNDLHKIINTNLDQQAIADINQKVGEIQQKYSKIAPELKDLTKDIERIKERANTVKDSKDPFVKARCIGLEKKLRQIFMLALPTMKLLLLEQERIVSALKNYISLKDTQKIHDLLFKASTHIDIVQISKQLSLFTLACDWGDIALYQFLQSKGIGPKSK